MNFFNLFIDKHHTPYELLLIEKKYFETRKNTVELELATTRDKLNKKKKEMLDFIESSQREIQVLEALKFDLKSELFGVDLMVDELDRKFQENEAADPC